MMETKAERIIRENLKSLVQETEFKPTKVYEDGIKCFGLIAFVFVVAMAIAVMAPIIDN